MTLNKREKQIAGALGGIVAAYLAVSYLVLPYFSSRSDLSAAIVKAESRQKHEDDLIANQPRVEAEWKNLTMDTLMTQESKSVIMLHDQFYEWAGRTGFGLLVLTPGRPVQKGDFKEIKFSISGQSNTDSLGRFLGAIERSDLPLRVDDVGITPKKDRDDLTVGIKVSTVIYSPAAPKNTAAKATGDDE